MFKVMAGMVALAAAGSVAWGATQGVSVGEIIHGVEHLTVAKDEHGNWSIRIDDPGDEVGFVKAMHDDVAFNQFNAAEMLQMGQTTCGWLRNGSGPNEIINWMDQRPGMAGYSPVLRHKVELDLITNSQVYLCPDTLHNGTVSTPTPTTTAPPAPTGPTTTTATTATATTSPTPTTTPPFHAGTSDVSAVGTGGTRQFVAVRLARHDGYDRLVLEFVDGVPGYTVGYRPLPAHADGSGDEIPLPGASALVQVVLTGATGSGWSGGARTYFGPSTVSADTEAVTEAKAAGDYEAVLTWVVGLRAKVPFRVLVLDGPPRLVVDFQH